MEPLHILYEDPHLVICCKPVGVLSEDGQAGRCMPQLLREHYRSLGQKNPYIATVHRLDKITGGVMVFSRRREVTGKLTAAVQAHEIVKEYLAVLRGHPAEPAATLTDLLFRDAGHNKSYVVKRPRKGVREASLFYRELSRTEELSLVRVQLHTGRTHQIRVQFSSRGLPLLWQQGPPLYRGPVVLPPGLPPSCHRRTGGRVLSTAPGLSLGPVPSGGSLKGAIKRTPLSLRTKGFFWSLWPDSNRRPAHYE